MHTHITYIYNRYVPIIIVIIIFIHTYIIYKMYIFEQVFFDE